MSFVTIGIISVVLMLFLMAFGVPIGLTFFITSIISGTSMIGLDRVLHLLGDSLYFLIATPSYASLPLFILMGAFAERADLAKRAFSGLYKLTQGLPGALGIATCYSCAAFGAVSGSSIATAAVFGKLVLPEMLRYKYNKYFALGIIASAATFASMIPPSIGLIVYGIFTNQSIGRLFAAGIIPGILTATVYTFSIIYRVKKNPALVPRIIDEKKITIKEKILSIKELGPIFIIALIVLGGLYGGFFTITESAGVGAFVTLIFGIVLGKLSKLEYFLQALKESASTTSMIFFIIIGAMFYGRVLALSGIPSRLVMLLRGFDVPRLVILGLILFIWFILGMLMNPTSMYALTLPILFPIITNLGYDPIWFGIIACKLGEIGAVTPPVGLNVYVLQGVCGEGTNINIEDIFLGILPFILCDIVLLILMIVFPQIVLFLPNLLLGH